MPLAPRKAAAVDLEHVGVKADLLQAHELFEISVHGKIDTILINRGPLSAARGITENLADVGDCEFDALLLEWIGK